MTRISVKTSATSFRLAVMVATSLTVVGATSPTAYADKRTPAPIVFASSGNTPAPQARPVQSAPKAKKKKKRRFSFGRKKSSESTKRVAAPAEPTRRVEFRYPDQPDTFYGESGPHRVANADPLSFSSSEAAVTQEEAAKLTVGAPPALPAAQPAPIQAVQRDPAITSGGFDARAAAAKIEAKSNFVSAAGVADFTTRPAVVSEPLAPLENTPAVQKTSSDVAPVAASSAAQPAVYDKTGSAYVFDRALHGLPTSNGEVLDTLSMTAAHPSLPLPSLVQVINLSNGKEVVVRVNDRGPIDGNGIIEVSEKAAAVLGFENNGNNEVRVRYLGDAPALDTKELAPVAPVPAVPVAKKPLLASVPNSGTPSFDGEQFMVQLASFSDIGNAQRMYESLNGRVGDVQIVSAVVNGTNYFRVVAGPLNDRKSAETLRDRLANTGVGRGLVITAP